MEKDPIPRWGCNNRNTLISRTRRERSGCVQQSGITYLHVITDPDPAEAWRRPYRCPGIGHHAKSSERFRAPLMDTFRHMTQNTMNHTPGVPLDPYTKLADAVLRFASAVDDLLKDELAYPFSIGSEALRDRAVPRHKDHGRAYEPIRESAPRGRCAVRLSPRVRRALAGAEGLLRAPFPLARTCAVAAAKAWFILAGATREERLQRYLNEELDALYRTPWDFADPGSQAGIATRTADYVAIGATVGLRPERNKNAKDWGAAYLVRWGQGRRDRSPSETEVVRDVFAAAGVSRVCHTRCSPHDARSVRPRRRLRIHSYRSIRERCADESHALVTRHHGQGHGARRDCDADPPPRSGAVRERAGGVCAGPCGRRARGVVRDRRSLGAGVTCRGRKCFHLGKTLHSSNTDATAYF
jgi:hypothetical protein